MYLSGDHKLEESSASLATNGIFSISQKGDDSLTLIKSCRKALPSSISTCSTIKLQKQLV